MRIRVTNFTRVVSGGIETYLQGVLPILAERGHTLGFLTDAPIWSGEPAMDTARSVAHVWEGATPAMLAQVAGAFRPDCVFHNGLNTPELEGAVARQFPTIFFAHNYYGTCISGTRRHLWPKLALCDRTFWAGVPRAVFSPAVWGQEPGHHVLALWPGRARLANLAHFRHVIVASTHMQKEYARHGVKPERLRLVPLPVLCPTGPEPQPRPRQDRVLFMARLTNLKGGDLLIRALPMASQRLGRTLSLTIAGDGAEESHLR